MQAGDKLTNIPLELKKVCLYRKSSWRKTLNIRPAFLIGELSNGGSIRLTFQYNITTKNRTWRYMIVHAQRSCDDMFMGDNLGMLTLDDFNAHHRFELKDIVRTEDMTIPEPAFPLSFPFKKLAGGKAHYQQEFCQLICDKNR